MEMTRMPGLRCWPEKAKAAATGELGGLAGEVPQALGLSASSATPVYAAGRGPDAGNEAGPEVGSDDDASVVVDVSIVDQTGAASGAAFLTRLPSTQFNLVWANN